MSLISIEDHKRDCGEAQAEIDALKAHQQSPKRGAGHEFF